MNKFLLNRLHGRVVAAVAALVLSGSALLAQNATVPASGQRSDGQIEMDVVQALDASQALKNDLITAATVQGQVTLSGTVASDADRQLAESIVKKVDGVTGVKNNLTVGNPADDANAAGSPADDSGPPVESQAENPSQQPEPGYGPPKNTPQQGGSSPSRPQYGGSYPPQQPGYGQQGRNYPPPPPPGYGPAYPPPPPGYARPSYPRPAPTYTMPRGPITIGPGAVLQVRTNDSLDSKKAQPGTALDFTVMRDVLVNGYLAIPRGATAHGVVTLTKSAGQLSGTPEIALRLTSLDLGGRNYPLDSDEFMVKGPNKTAHTASDALGGAMLGALIGGVAGRGSGAAIGAAAGGAAGTAASAASNPRAWIPAEAPVTFHLNSPLTVDPVSQEEANRLAQGLTPGGPQLRRRGFGYTAYPPGYYGYPPVYYRPYYLMNGYYYWR